MKVSWRLFELRGSGGHAMVREDKIVAVSENDVCVLVWLDGQDEPFRTNANFDKLTASLRSIK